MLELLIGIIAIIGGTTLIVAFSIWASEAIHNNVFDIELKRFYAIIIGIGLFFVIGGIVFIFQTKGCKEMGERYIEFYNKDGKLLPGKLIRKINRGRYKGKFWVEIRGKRKRIGRDERGKYYEV